MVRRHVLAIAKFEDLVRDKDLTDDECWAVH
jgi:hypothetical protein